MINKARLVEKKTLKQTDYKHININFVEAFEKFASFDFFDKITYNFGNEKVMMLMKSLELIEIAVKTCISHG